MSILKTLMKIMNNVSNHRPVYCSLLGPCQGERGAWGWGGLQTPLNHSVQNQNFPPFYSEINGYERKFCISDTWLGYLLTSQPCSKLVNWFIYIFHDLDTPKAEYTPQTIFLHHPDALQTPSGHLKIQHFWQLNRIFALVESVKN